MRVEKFSFKAEVL